MRGAALIRPKLPPASRAGGFFLTATAVEIAVNSEPRASSFSGRKGVPLAGAQDNDMPTPSPFAAYHANCRTALTPRFPAVWLFILAALVLPPLLAFIATALWLVWMCF